jgi:hypothetical protein
MSEKPDRLRALLDAGIALTGELSLDGVLQKIVEPKRPRIADENAENATPAR